MPPDQVVEDQTTENSRENTQESRNPTQSVEEYDPLTALRGLAPGARITVHRQTPAYAKGFLDHLTIPQAGEIDIESEIKTNWGGGTFKLQPRQLSANGKMNFGRGCVILSIAGEPMLNGRRYVNGLLEEPSAAAPVAAMQPFMMPNPTQSNRAGLEGQLLTMVQQTLSRAGAPNGTGVDLAGLGTIITALSGMMGGMGAQPTQQGDAMGEMDRAFSLLTKMQKLSGMGATEPSGESKDDDSDSFMGGGGWQQMLMMKLMGGAQTPQPPQYAPHYPQQPPQNWGQQQPTQPHQQPPQRPNPSQPPNWPAPPAGVPYQQPTHGSPPPQAPPQSSQATPADPATMDGPQAADAGGGDEEPFTVEHLQAELEHMDKPQRDKFMSTLMQKLGMDEKLGSLLGSVVPGVQTNGAPPASGPEVFPTGPVNVDAAFNRDD